ncbi:MAG: TRAP transporter small permease [Dehalococcoidia bacterium]|nr:TRAP transporter small permease [Dehalococcoidia bacterium]
MTAIANTLSKVVTPISRYGVVVSATVLALMMFLTGADVLLRYVFNRPIMGSLEITEFMMSMTVGFGLAYCALKKGHIRVDLVLIYIPQKARRIMDVVAYVVSFAFYCLIVWQVLLNGRSLMDSKLTSSVLFIPVYPFVFLLVIGAAILALVFLKDVLESIHEVMKK